MPRTFKLSAARPVVGQGVLDELNDQQRSVVEAPGGPMLVIAGAGSGKTRTLTARLARLIGRGVAPERMLLVTFTNRAAREMLHRVESLVREDALRVWGGTFHHVANRVLRQAAHGRDRSPDFTILDREDARDLLGGCVGEAGVRITARRFPAPDVLLSMASVAANNLQPIEEVVRARHPVFTDRLGPIAAVLRRYAERKRERHLLDYDDLLVEWLRLLDEDPALRETLADRFEHVLVDEYQDTNAIQGRIVDLLAARHRNVCVVGDDAQSIYSFRGATVENLLGFRTRYPDAVEHRLELNYRSTPQILALANDSIACNTRRLPKRLRAVRADGLRPAVVPCGDHFVQSRFIAEYILHLLDEGRALTDIAVLYRSHWHGLEIQLELQRHDVPFAVRGGIRFFEQAHVKDVLSFLRLRHNGGDELAWLRVLRMPPRVGGAMAQRLWRHLASTADPLAAVRGEATLALLPPAARSSFASFVRVLDRLAETTTPSAMIEMVLDLFYRDHLASHHENAELREQDLHGVAEFAAQYRTVEAFLSDVALTGEFTGETCVTGPEEQLFVTLSTVHQAKGLEWPVVLIPWVSDGRFPTDLAMNRPEDLEEERRVFHVAVTRARDELYLVVPQVWSTHRGERILMKPSRFLSELDGRELVETMRLEDDLPALTSGR